MIFLQSFISYMIKSIEFNFKNIHGNELTQKHKNQLKPHTFSLIKWHFLLLILFISHETRIFLHIICYCIWNLGKNVNTTREQERDRERDRRRENRGKIKGKSTHTWTELIKKNNNVFCIFIDVRQLFRFHVKKKIVIDFYCRHSNNIVPSYHLCKHIWPTACK